MIHDAAVLGNGFQENYEIFFFLFKACWPIALPSVLCRDLSVFVFVCLSVCASRSLSLSLSVFFYLSLSLSVSAPLIVS